MRRLVLAKRASKGYTLIELMVAMLLGLFLITGLVQIFITSKQSYRMQETLSRLQESGRFALEFIDRDVRMAGFRGCASKSKTLATNVLGNKANYPYIYATAIQGFDNVASNWNGVDPVSSTATGVTANLPNQPLVDKSDVITIRRAADDGVQATNAVGTTGVLTLNRDTKPPLKNCDVVMAADCQSATIFQASGVAVNADDTATIAHAQGGCAATAAGGNGAAALDKNYKGGTFYKMATTSYYLKTNPNGVPALYRIVNSNPEEELVEGIEQMQVYYGVDTDSDGFANTYVTANPAPVWANVVSVRITLLTRTVEDNIASETLTYNYDGNNNITPNPTDRRIRRVFTTTIAIRNKLL
jgi:type IV pilus assembly protein PilW